MKLASIILPIADNEGEALFYEHEQLKHDLLKRWHGFTAVDVRGAWQGPDDQVMADASVRYDIAMPLADVVHLRDLASDLAIRCRQECIMIVTPNGDVCFVKSSVENKVDEPA